MKTQKISFLILLALALFLWVGCSDNGHQKMSGLNSIGGGITITNAKIWTGDPDDPWKNGITVINGKIVAMNADNPTGKILDARGCLIVPGFWDAHCHPQTLYVLTSPEAPTLFETQSVKDVLDVLREYITGHPEDKYPRLFGWMDNIFKEGEHPKRELIDAVVSDRPVYLVHRSGHCHWTNTAALELAGILEEDPPFLPTGHIERDPETGLATGYLEETELASTAGVLLASVKKLKPLSFEEQVFWQKTVLDQYSSVGVTSIWTKDGDEDITSIYEEILRNDVLPVRTILDNLYTPYSQIGDIERYAQRAEAIKNSPDLPKGFLRADGIKLMVDLPYHAWMFEPYADDPTNCGYPVYEMDEFKSQVFEADRLGLQINLLVIGDRALHEGMNILEETVKVNPPRKRRHSAEHAEYIKDQDLPRFKELNIIPVMNSINSYPDPDFMAELEKHIGKTRLEHEYQRYRALVDAEAMVTNGSDFPLSQMDPLYHMHIMVNGTDVNGEPEGGHWPWKLISIEEALRIYTTNAAYQAFEDHRSGMLKKGYDADFVMLSKNILDPSFDQRDLLKVKVLLTVFNGHIVHR